MTTRLAVVAFAVAGAFLGSYALGNARDGSSEADSARPVAASTVPAGKRAPVSRAVPVPAAARLPGLRDAPAAPAPRAPVVRRAPVVSSPAPIPVAPRPKPAPKPEAGTPFFDVE